MIKLEDESEYVISQLVASRLIQIVDAISVQDDFADIRRIQQTHHMQQRTLP